MKRKKDDEIVEEEVTIYKRFERWIGEKESCRAVLETFMIETPEKIDEQDGLFDV